MLAIPFNLLAIAIALNLFLGGWRGQSAPFGMRLKISPPGFLVAALTLGGLAFLNTWDILVGAALIVLAYVLRSARADGWTWARLGDLFATRNSTLRGGRVAVPAVLFWFFVAGGRHPAEYHQSDARRAALGDVRADIRPAACIPLATSGTATAGVATGCSLAVLVVGLVIFLWAISWGIAWLALIKDPAFAQQFLASQGASDPAALFRAASLRRLSYVGGLADDAGDLVARSGTCAAGVEPGIRPNGL